MSKRPNPKTIWLFKLTPLNPDGFSKNLLSIESLKRCFLVTYMLSESMFPSFTKYENFHL